jgi:hypothetical protein
MAVLDTLIDKEDGFEIVRDQIAAILTLEIANQKTLATAATEDPDDWDVLVFLERSNAFEQWLNSQTDDPPRLVNIWYDNGNFPEGKGGVVEKQEHVAIYNIDCYGLGVSEDDGDGHKPGDREAALEAQKTVRLIRNILMAAINTYLQARGLVGQRWIQSITSFQPQIESRAIQKVVGARIVLRVRLEETSPQVTPETLELLTNEIKRSEDGQVVLLADYEYPL